MKSWLSVVWALALVLPGWVVAIEEAPASSKPVVQVGMLLFPGYSEPDEQGEPVGRSVEQTRMLLTEAGYPSDIRILPAARIWRGLESGEVHLWPGILNKPDLDAFTLITSGDLGRVGINLYYLPGQEAPVIPEDLRGKRLILITNYTYTREVLDSLRDPRWQISFDRSSSHAGALEMLLRGRGDFLLGYRAQINSLYQELDMAPLPYVRAAEQPKRLILSTQSGFAEQLRADLDSAYERLRDRGAELDVREWLIDGN